MPTAERQKLVDRLAAVETLAQRGATAGERQAARSRAQRLRERHGITDSELHGLKPLPLCEPSWEAAATAYARTRAESVFNNWYDEFYVRPFQHHPRQPKPEPLSNNFLLACTCGHVTTRTVLQPNLTAIIGYRCTGCGSQRRYSEGEFTITRAR